MIKEKIAIDFLSQDFIKKINKFLNSENPEPLKYKNNYFYGISKSTDFINFLDNQSGINSDLKKDIVLFVLNKMPVLDTNYSEYRDFDLKGFHLYSPTADKFSSFRIANFKAPMNDLNELRWLRFC